MIFCCIQIIKIILIPSLSTLQIRKKFRIMKHTFSPIINNIYNSLQFFFLLSLQPRPVLKTVLRSWFYWSDLVTWLQLTMFASLRPGQTWDSDSDHHCTPPSHPAEYNKRSQEKKITSYFWKAEFELRPSYFPSYIYVFIYDLSVIYHIKVKTFLTEL